MSLPETGKVYLIGAGPGDPGLLTLKGRDYLSRSQVVVYDHLVNKAILRHAPRTAELIYAGKKAGHATLEQEEINAILIARAKEGKIVSRLKGGDPFIFGRGGEEAQALQQQGIPFAVAPGVSSVIAVSAYAGIPLTHRTLSSSISIITGSAEKSHDDILIDWENMARRTGTLVFLMGARRLPVIVEKLLEFGKNPKTPVAIVRKGSTGKQRTWTGTLDTIVEIAMRDQIAPPALTIIGEVVRMKPEMDWYETLPLFGKTIVVTRPEHQAAGLIDLLQEKGADAVNFPVIQTVEPDDWTPLDAALGRLSEYHGLIFTSVNGVDFFMQRLKETRRDLRDLKGVRIYAIGPKTEQAIRALGLRVDVRPEQFVAESLIKSMSQESFRGKRFLLPRASVAREILPEQIREAGGEIDVVSAYQTIAPDAFFKTELNQSLESGEIDVVTFTSSSTVTNFMELVEPANRERLSQVALACIGPITADTLKQYGFTASVIPKDYTVEALAEGIESFFNSARAPNAG